MAKKKATPSKADSPPLQAEFLESAAPVAGVEGPGQWLVLRYEPTSLFSLKMSMATSTVGKTLLTPTPYSIKMAFLDAALRTGWKGDPETLVTALARADVRIGVPARAVVTHTIVKIRQEPKERKTGAAYGSAVAYREFVHYGGALQWAFNLRTTDEQTADAVAALAPVVQYIGKRGGFVQFLNKRRERVLPVDFSQPLRSLTGPIPTRAHIAILDDFGPEANLRALNSYSSVKIRLDKDRTFVETIVPLGLVSVGPGFAEYASASQGY